MILEYFLKNETAPVFTYAGGKKRGEEGDDDEDMYDENGEQKSVFYSEGSKELREFITIFESRLKIAKYSIPRAQ